MHIVDFDALIDTVRMVREVLADLATHPNQVLSPELWEPFRAAMVDLGVVDGPSWGPNDPVPYTQVQHMLDELNRLREVLATEPVPATTTSLFMALSDHGLSGPQLMFKKAVIDAAYADYVAHGRVGEIPKDDARWFRRTGRRIIRFLGPASTALDSLAEVIPFGGAIAEAAGLAGQAIELHRDRKKR